MARMTRLHGNALKTDLYELTMAAGYFRHCPDLRAAFELSCHTMPSNRKYLLACGLQQVVDYVVNLRFDDEDIKFLRSLPIFKSTPKVFFDYLKKFRFTGDVWAMPEGEVFFAKEPVIQVEAPIIEAQILETYLLSVMNIETLVATKASRIVRAACHDGTRRDVVDFGARRAHGPQAGVLAARAAYIAGCLGTSNVRAGQMFGIPLFGTIAHSWVEAFDSEEKSFAKYHETFPENTILLVDTYDTIQSVRNILRMGLKDDLRALRFDSGNLNVLSRSARRLLDEAGLNRVRIIASGNLNEYKVWDLVAQKAPIDIFGVGTDMVTSRDNPALDFTYKLVQISGRGGVQFKAKHSPRKRTVPGRKQVFRRYTGKGLIAGDMVGLFGERPPKGARRLLEPVILKGRRVKSLPSIDKIRSSAAGRLDGLAPSFLSLKGACQAELRYSRSLARLAK